jgi:LPXTG-motif cell wall-anchored protein
MSRGTVSRRTGRRVRRLLVAASISAAVAAAGAVVPAGAGSSDDPGLRALCNELAKDPPQGGAEQITDPPTGARIRAGQKVTVTLRWDRRDFAGDLRQAGHCIVGLDGRPRLELSAVEAPSANDGEYRGSFVMPAELAPGDCLCILGVASGDAPGGGPLRVGGNSCLTVTEPAPPVPPAAPATSPQATSVPAGPPATVLPATLTAPSEPGLSSAAQTGPQPLAELPRTGPHDVRLLLALGGLALFLGGGAITTRR